MKEERSTKKMRVNRRELEIIQAKLGITSKELINRAGISSATYHKLRLGKDVSPLVIGKIAKAFQCDIETLTKDE